MFAKSDEIPSFSVQDIKAKPKCCGQRLRRAINLTELAPSPFFSFINVYPVDISLFTKFDEIPTLPVQFIKEPKAHGPQHSPESTAMKAMFSQNIVNVACKKI